MTTLSMRATIAATAMLPDYAFLRRLAALPFVEAIWLFGSRVGDRHAPRADIDLAVNCPRATDRDWQQVMDIVEDADTLLAIDCVRLDALAPTDPLRRAIERDRRLLYEKTAA